MPNKARVYRARTADTGKPIGQRKSADERGYDSRWRRFRAAYIRANGLCLMCRDNNVVRASVIPHHRDGLGPRGPRGYDEDNLIPVCREHHAEVHKGDQRGG